VNKFEKQCSGLLLVGTLLIAVVGCQNKEDGPAEHAGKAIDNAAVKVGEKVEKAGDKIQDAAKGDSK
jgi:hypothetical protein